MWGYDLKKMFKLLRYFILPELLPKKIIGGFSRMVHLLSLCPGYKQITKSNQLKSYSLYCILRLVLGEIIWNRSS